MALGIFIVGVDEIDTILSIRSSIINGSFVENGGLTVVSWSSEGSAVTKQFAMSQKDLLLECNAFLKAADPTTYGRKVTRTRPSYLY